MVLAATRAAFDFFLANSISLRKYIGYSDAKQLGIFAKLHNCFANDRILPFNNQ